MIRKLIFTIFFSTFYLLSTTAQNQEGLFSLGVNMSYGSEKDLIGFGVRGQYGIVGHIRGVTEYKYYIDRRNWSEWQISMDLHYMLEASRSVSVYPIAGVRFSRWTYDNKRGGVPEELRRKESENRLGLNLGLGTQIELANNVYLQLEPKYEVTKDFGQFAGSIGLMFLF